MNSSFEEFVSLWNKDTPKYKKNLKHLLFLVTYPDNLKWDFSVEKQTQTTTLMLSGGDTGAGSGHYIKFCRQSKVNDILKNEINCTHAMICSVGWVADMTNLPTPIMNFNAFSQGDAYCKAHIIAKPDQNAYLHHQHIELNLVKWRELGCPDIYAKWNNYTRSSDNYHDDYTPFWIIPEGLPKIDNFTHKEREKKAFSYPHRDYNSVWKDLSTVDNNDYYFSRYMTRMNSSYYVYNTEKYQNLPDKKFDLYMAPTAGYLTEQYCYNNNFKGDVIIYDYVQENIDIKRKIVEMNMSFDDIKELHKSFRNVSVDYSSSKYDTLKNGNDKHIEYQKMQDEMFNNCNIEYWLLNLIQPDYNKIIEKVKGKTVFFRASNIFSYHMSHAYFTINELFNSYFKLINALQHADNCWFTGAKPTKQRSEFWV